MSGEQDPLIRMAGDVGYMRGAFDGMTEQNTKDHDEIKERLEAGDKKFTEICDEVRAQAKRHKVLEGRVSKVEKDQRAIAGLAGFVTSHPRLVIVLVAGVVVTLTGLSLDQVLALLGGG